jgi:hypothetical protein
MINNGDDAAFDRELDCQKRSRRGRQVFGLVAS